MSKSREKQNGLLFVGTYSETITLGTGQVLKSKGEGIYVFRMNLENGSLKLLYKALGEPNPSYVSLDKTKRYLYSTNELKTFKGIDSGAASAFKLDPQSGRLSLLNRKLTGGTDAVHLLVNDKNTHLLVANFMSGSVCVLPFDEDGALANPSCFLQHYGTGPNPVRQRCSHAHGFELDTSNERAFVPDLGSDRVYIYKTNFTTGHLNENSQPYVQLKPGEGPRHCVFDHSGKFLYVINEMGNTIYSYAYDDKQGVLTEIQIISTIPQNYHEHTTTSAIKVHPNGNFLYGSNRGHDSLATYKINHENGLLELVAIQSTLGRVPRDFDFTPDGKFLVVANQESNNLIVFRVDGDTGLFYEVSRVNDVFTGTCVKIYEMD